MLNVGEVLEGRYRILGTIDTGGMGTVLLAEHVLIKRKLAIKVLHENLAADPKVVERFMNEASVAGRLGHPNIVESTDMGFVNGKVPFIVFEYLEGALLTSEIYRVQGGLTVRRALRIANQIAAALDAAHNAGIVHRDLKTDNIFLVKRDDVVDHVKVLDFGVSRFVEAEETAMVIGTPEYMAPEQIVSPDKVDRRTDVYALGVVLYEMITARRPFPNKGDAEELLRRIVSEPPPPLTRGEAPPGLQEMIFTKMLAKDPAERYDSMRDVQGAIAAFHGITRPTPVSVPIVNVLQPAPAPTPVPVVEAVPATAIVKRRPSRAWLGVGVLGLLVGGAGVGLLAVPPEKTTTATTPLATIEAHAAQLAIAFEATANANQLRAEGLAMTPMLRAAMETDAATFRDMVQSGDFAVQPKPDEVVEIYQRGTTLLLKMPATAQTVGAKTGVRYAARGNDVVATVGVPVTAQVDGLVVVSSVVDLAPLRTRLGEHVRHAVITGLGDTITLAGTRTDGVKLSAPIKTGGVLETTVVAPTTTVTDRFATIRLALWGSGGLLLMVSLCLLLLRRR